MPGTTYQLEVNPHLPQRLIRLEELANTVVSLVEHRPPKPVVEPTPKSEQDETAVAIALLSSGTGSSSPAWDRLTELCSNKLEAGPS